MVISAITSFEAKLPQIVLLKVKATAVTIITYSEQPSWLLYRCLWLSYISTDIAKLSTMVYIQGQQLNGQHEVHMI